MPKKQRGFTLIELLIVIAIIGILAAIAIPMYRTQTIKAKLTEVTNGISNVASALAAYRQENGAWPGDITTLAMVRDSLGVSLGALTRLAGISISNGVITATIASGIDDSVTNRTLVLSPTVNADGSIQWNWDSSSTVPTAYLPKR